jgi:carboxyl-terminal processing protease
MKLAWPSATLSAAACCVMAVSAHAEPQRASPYHKLSIFARALAHIEQSYVSDVDADTLIYGAIRGMLGVLDPHSAFMDPQQAKILDDDAQGRYAGIGVEIDVRDGWLTVVAVLPGGPAQRAGLLPGDRFISLDGVSARDMPIDQAQLRMRGEPGTQARVVLRRDSDAAAIDRVMTREFIDVRAIDSRVLPDRVAYVHLRAFQESTAGELRRALDEAVERCAAAGGLRGVLLDLRDNPGGLLSAAVLVADEFLERGVIVTTRGRGDRLLREQSASAAGTRPAWPMVVLVNGYSASAAEIVAGALQDHERAVLVGTRTFGKGSVQNVIDLPDHSALKLTTALYFTPSGRSIQAQGIEPDVRIEAIDARLRVANEASTAPSSEAGLARHLLNASPADAARPTSRGYRTAAQAAAASVAEPFEDDVQARVAHQILGTLLPASRHAPRARTPQ